MNKTKQEMLALVDELFHYAGYTSHHVSQENHMAVVKKLQSLRTLITDSVILSDGEIEGMKETEKPSDDLDDGQFYEEVNRQEGHNAALDKIKDMK